MLNPDMLSIDVGPARFQQEDQQRVGVLPDDRHHAAFRDQWALHALYSPPVGFLLQGLSAVLLRVLIPFGARATALAPEGLFASRMTRLSNS